MNKFFRGRFFTALPILQVLMFRLSDSYCRSLKGGDPAAPSDTATLLRLHPSHWSCLRRLAPCGCLTGFGHSQLPWCDGRCVQGPGTYSPRHADPRLLATPTSCGRVAAHNPNWDHFFEFRSTLRFRFSLSWPL